MKTVRKDSVTGYKLDFATNTLTVNYKFNKALSDFGSPEYNRYKDSDLLSILTLHSDHHASVLLHGTLHPLPGPFAAVPIGK